MLHLITRRFAAVILNTACLLIPLWSHADLVAEWEGETAIQSGVWPDIVGGFDLAAHRFNPTTAIDVTPKTPDRSNALRFETADTAVVNTSNGGPLDGATEFTVAVVFRANSDGESNAVNQFHQKSQLVSAGSSGSANDWGLGYANDHIWFGMRDQRKLSSGLLISADVTLSRDGGTLNGDWRIAVCTWAGDYLASGEPRMGAWIFDADLKRVGADDLVDPNTLAGLTGLFDSPRDSQFSGSRGLCIGGDRNDPNIRNFDGWIAGVQIYSHVCLDYKQATGIALVMAAKHLTPDRTVTNADESGPGSLRQILNDAPSPARVLFDASLDRKTIITPRGLSFANKDIAIDASSLPGGLTISGAMERYPVFMLSQQTVAIDGVTITSGGMARERNDRFSAKAKGMNYYEGGGFVGGSGTILHLQRTSMTGNAGRGIDLTGDDTSLAMYGCTVDHNGSIGISAGSTASSASLFHTTVAGNRGGLASDGVMRLRNTTVTGNASLHAGGGVAQNGGILLVENSIVAGNRSYGGSADMAGISGSEDLRTAGANLIGSNEGVEAAFPAGPTVGTVDNPLDPRLAPLAWYGGRTMTLHPLANSKAVDASGSSWLSPSAADARGFPRDVCRSSDCWAGIAYADLGAVEAGRDYTVQTTQDVGDDSLRSVLSAVSAGAHIMIAEDIAGQPITLDSELEIEAGKHVFIEAPAVERTTIDAENNGRAFSIGPNSSLALYNVDIAHGNAGSEGGGGVRVSADATFSLVHGTLAECTAGGEGGGIHSQGRVAIVSATIAQNQSSGQGGGIHNERGDLVMRNSTVHRNQSREGAVRVTTYNGTSVSGCANLLMVNCTLAHNTAQSVGAGLSLADVGSRGVIVHCTIASNKVSGSRGGGIFLFNTDASLANTIVFGNSAPTGPDIHGTVTRVAGLNLVGDPTGASGLGSENFDYITGDPQLGPLSHNGGPPGTLTMLVGENSPAQDAAPRDDRDSGEDAVVTAGAWDQRGPFFPRIIYRPDIGACERRTPGAIDLGIIAAEMEIFALDFDNSPAAHSALFTLSGDLRVRAFPDMNIGLPDAEYILGLAERSFQPLFTQFPFNSDPINWSLDHPNGMNSGFLDEGQVQWFRFRITDTPLLTNIEPGPGPDRLRLTWLSRPGKTYEIRQSTNLSAGFIRLGDKESEGSETVGNISGIEPIEKYFLRVLEK